MRIRLRSGTKILPLNKSASSKRTRRSAARSRWANTKRGHGMSKARKISRASFAPGYEDNSPQPAHGRRPGYLGDYDLPELPGGTRQYLSIFVCVPIAAALGRLRFATEVVFAPGALRTHRRS